MDTILYFYKKKGLREPEAEPVGLKNHMLIRIAMDVQKEEWFGINLGEQGQKGSKTGRSEGKLQRMAGIESKIQRQEMGKAPEQKPVGEAEAEESLPEPAELQQSCKPLLFPWKALTQFLRCRAQRRQEQERRRAEEQERQRQEALEEEYIRAVENSMGKLVSEMRELAGDLEECFCVYEDSVRRWLIQETASEITGFGNSEKPMPREYILSSLWEKYFQAEEFRSYQDRFWVNLLLPRAESEHFVILGTAPCLFSVIEECAGRMKSLHWFLREAEYSDEIEEFTENFYIEYGLAITLQILEGTTEWRKLRLACGQPVNILDFTGEARISVSDVCQGSIWLDMLSVEEKQRRIAAQGRGIRYFSLKEYWKKAQKRCNCPILP